MRWRTVTFDIFIHATASTGRLLLFLAVEGVFIAIGALFAFFIIPMLQGLVDDSDIEPSLIPALAMEHYWMIPTALLLHAALSGAVLPRLRAPWLGVWIGIGMLLPLLTIVIALIAVGGVYAAVLSGL